MSEQQAVAMKCPASMCPLIAKDGSPWTGRYDSPCPGRDPEDEAMQDGGCPWWGMACQGGGMAQPVYEAERNGGSSFVVGPNRPKRDEITTPKTYECPKAHECRWQEQAGEELCPPRLALSKGIDPRVCLF